MKKLILFLVSLSIFLLPALSFATSANYPTNLQEKISKHELKDQKLKDELFLVISSNQKPVGYDNARIFLYSKLHITTDSRGTFLKDVYCNQIQMTSNRSGNINCEHTWPQSKFNKEFDIETQKSDMHHLFPTNMKANSIRGHFDFAEVVSNLNLINCDASKSGASVVSGGINFFEPPTEHKGNVARALFYFSVRYKISMNPEQETFLRKWNEQDPVDDAEMTRNDVIEKLQGNRNPFIDFPNLPQDISKF